MIVADRICEILAAVGVRRAYGLPGEDHIPLLAALPAAGIEYHTACNESSAVIMAATDAKVSGVPGVAILSMATGVSNGMNGIVHAYMEGLPVIVLSGRWAAARHPRVVRQGFDPENIVRHTTKWTSMLATADEPALWLCKAIDIATTSRPGPVYLEISDEISTATCTSTDNAAVEVLATQLSRRAGRSTGPVPGEGAIAQLSGRLEGAERPAVIVGGRSNAVSRETLTLFAETFRAPVLTSPGQKGVLTTACPYFAGAFLNGNPEGQLLQRSDLVVAINPEAFDYLNRAWPNADATVAVCTEPLNEWLFPFADRVVADPETVLSELVKRSSTGGRSQWTPSDVAEHRERIRGTLLGVSGARMSVADAVDTVLSASPTDAYVLADAGFSKPLITMLSETSEPSRFLVSNALSTMGFGIPAALATSLSANAPTLCFMGDGSLLMRATELVVARHVREPLVFVSIMDKSLSQIEIKQERRDAETVGVELPELSCGAIGPAFGVRGVDAHDIDELRAAVTEAFNSDGCTLIGAHVDPAGSRPLFEALRG